MDHRLVIPVVALALLTAAVPGDAYRAQTAAVPPQETGVGRNDVRDEPNSAPDRVAPGNGFAQCGTVPGASDGTSCQDRAGTLVLEAYYESNLGAANADVNNLLRVLTAEAGAVEHEDRMYPGLGYLGAYWGWWTDTGQGASLNDAGEVPTLAGGAPNGAIDDAHDADEKSWDEFVWRGDNQWADLHQRPSRSGDVVHAFIQPGTWHNVIFQLPYPPPVFDLDCCGYLLRDDHDHGDVPDLEYSDRTSLDPEVEDQGWVTGAGFPHVNYDASLLVATEATTAVNAPLVGEGTRDVGDADAADVDLYTTLHPTLADLYQQTVWDPGDRDDGSDDSGPKDTIKDAYTSFALRSEDQLAEWRDQATRPAAGPQGAAEDAAGERVRPHEPNQPGDVYPGASQDPDTVYGALAGDTDAYYEPGDDQKYEGYRKGEEAFLDIRPGYGVPVFPVQRYSFNLGPAPNLGSPLDQGDQRTASPGFLSFRGNFGTWWDTTEDTFVGNLEEFGRMTSEAEPYRDGTVEDPNDYGDHPVNHEGNPSKDHQWTPEWRGLCGGGDVEVTVVPDNPDQRWGATGVYVLRDHDGDRNPYDDAVEDAADDASQYVREGPVTVDMSCDSQNANEGEWLGEDYLLLPAGNADVTLKVTSVGTVTTDRSPRDDVDAGLGGQTVVDVDRVHDWT